MGSAGTHEGQQHDASTASAAMNPEGGICFDKPDPSPGQPTPARPCPHAPRAQYSVTTAGGSRHTPRYMTMEGWRRLAIMAASCAGANGGQQSRELWAQAKLCRGKHGALHLLGSPSQADECMLCSPLKG